MSQSTSPQWTVGPEVDMWGPQVTQPPPPAVAEVPVVNRRRPWGLGDVWWTGAALLFTQFAMLAVVCVLAVGNLAPTLAKAPEFGPAQMTAVMDEVLDMTKTPGFLVSAMFIQFLVFAGVPWIASRRKGLRSLAKDYGFTFTGKDVAVGAGVAVGLQVVMFGFGAAVRATGVDLSGADNTSLVTDNTGLTLVVMVLCAVVVAPLTEELLFRGLVFRAMLRSFAHRDLAADPRWADRHAQNLSRKGRTEYSPTRARVGVVISVLLSALVFGSLHTPMSDGTTTVTTAAQVMLVFQTGALGAVFAVIAYKMKRMGVNMWAHVFFNGISITLVLALGAG